MNKHLERLKYIGVMYCAEKFIALVMPDACQVPGHLSQGELLFVRRQIFIVGINGVLITTHFTFDGF